MASFLAEMARQTGGTPVLLQQARRLFNKALDKRAGRPFYLNRELRICHGDAGGVWGWEIEGGWGVGVGAREAGVGGDWEVGGSGAAGGADVERVDGSRH